LVRETPISFRGTISDNVRQGLEDLPNVGKTEKRSDVPRALQEVWSSTNNPSSGSAGLPEKRSEAPTLPTKNMVNLQFYAQKIGGLCSQAKMNSKFHG
jgi:hypothetical protein